MLMSVAALGISANWPPEILAKFGDGVEAEVRLPWSPARS